MRSGIRLSERRGDLNPRRTQEPETVFETLVLCLEIGAKHSKPQGEAPAAARGRSENRRSDRSAPPVDLDELWQRVRAGAATVAGVRYQLAVSAFLLAGARGQLELQELTPEGLEDVDCRLLDGEQLFVQAKDRAAGAGRFGLADLRAALEHAMEALRLDPRARLAGVTDAELAAGRADTGFE